VFLNYPCTSSPTLPWINERILHGILRSKNPEAVYYAIFPMLSYFRQNTFLRTRFQIQQPVGPSLLLSHFEPPRHVVQLCRLRVEININTSRKEVVWPGHRFLWSISQEFEPRLSQTKTYGPQNPFKALKSFYIPLGST
jgi:hypothetical protein